MARALRVLVATLRYPPYVAGGYELIARDVVEELRARGHRVDVLAGRGARHDGADGVLGELEPGLDGEDPLQSSLTAGDLERFRLHFLRPGNYRATVAAIRRLEPDVLFFFNLGLVSLAPLLAARHLELPTLGYVADPWPTNLWLSAWRENRVAAREKAGRMHALGAAWRGFRGQVGLGALLACSEHMARVLEDDGVPAEDLAVVLPGVPPEIEARTRGVEPRRRGAGEPLRIVCASTLWEGKGQHVLLEALARLGSRGEGIELVLAGDGDADYTRLLSETVAGRGLGVRVRLAGRLGRDELSALLADAHVLVQPSVWPEPFGRTTAEGMAHALAVVASDAGASPELVRDGREGLVVPAGDPSALAHALRRLARDEELRLRLAAAARARAAGELVHARFLDRVEAALARVAATARRERA